MNRTQVNNFLVCLSHIDDASYLGLHARANDVASTTTDASITGADDHDHDEDHDQDNHDLLVAKIVAMVVLFCATTICGSIPFMLNRYFKWTENNTNARSATVVKCLLYFGGGVLLCTTFLHLLPEVQETVEQLQECGTLPELPFALAEMLMCAGFFLMYLIEEVIHAYIHRHKRLLDQEPAGAAFERGHSVRNSYLVKGNQQRPQQSGSAPEKSTLESIECPAVLAANSANSNAIRVGLSAQDLIAHDLDQQKYQQAQAEPLDMPQKYSDNLEQLDHHHAHHHHHHHHDGHHHHHHHHDHGHGHSHLPIATHSDDMVASSLRGLLIVLALSLHELFEGMAIGLEGSASSVWFMFGAVSAHKLVLAFCVGVELIVAQTRPLLSVVYVVTFAIVSPIGIGIGILISHNDTSTVASIPSAVLQGLACGTLLYVVFFEILSKNRSGLLAYLALFVGFAVMFGLQSLGGDDDHGHSHGGCSSSTDSNNEAAKSLILSNNIDDQLQQHHHHHHDDHGDHTPEPTTMAASKSFEQQFQILRDASRELMNDIKKNN